jgi:hypothetical protein
MSFWNVLKANDSVAVKRITIHYIYSKTDTQHDISCNDFDAYKGKGGFMVKNLTIKAQICLFMKSLSNYKAPPLVKNIDVRAKAYIHYSNGKTSVACIDRFGDIMLDNEFIGVSTSLLSFLQKSYDGFE